MGVEPTAACSAQPATNFEGWGAHRDTITPTGEFNAVGVFWVTGVSKAQGFSVKLNGTRMKAENADKKVIIRVYPR